MARLWSSGFELNSTTNGMEWTAVTNGTISTTTVRSGTYAGRVTSFVSTVARGFLYQYVSPAGGGPYFVRFYFRYATAPSADNCIFSFEDDTTVAVTNTDAQIRLSSTGALKLFNNNTQVGSDSAALSSGTWYMIDVQYDATPAGGSQVLRARVDGVEFAGASNLTLADTTYSVVVFGGNLNGEAQTAGDWFFDDIAINNSTGSFQNSYPGPGEIIHLRPNAAGDNAQWTTGTGSSFAEVDEVTPDGATTIIGSSTLNNLSDFNVDATPAAMDSTDIINVVQVGVRFAEEDTGSAGRFALRIKASASGTVETSANINPTATAYNTNSVAAPRNHPLTLYDLPGASTTVWTKADLDTAQIGVSKTVADGLTESFVSTLWLLVDHTPGTVNHTVVTQDAALALTIDNTTITQNHVITPQDISLALTTDNDTISQNHIVATQDVALALTTDNTTISQNHTLPVADIQLDLTTDNTTVTETNFNLVSQDIALSLTEDSTTISQNHIMDSQDVALALTEDNTTIVENNLLVTQDIALSLTEDNTTVEETNFVLVPQDLLLSLAEDNATINQNHVVAVQDIALSLAEDATTITQDHVLTVADLLLSLTEDNTTIDQTNFVLTTQDILLSLTEDNTTLTQNHVLPAEDILLALTTDSTTIAQNHIIVSQDILLSLLEDNTTIDVFSGDIQPDNISLGVAMDNTTITQNHILASQDIALTLRLDGTKVLVPVLPRSYYIDTNGNIYWVLSQEIGLVEKI